MVIKIAGRSVAIRFFQYPKFLVYISVFKQKGIDKARVAELFLSFCPTLIDEPFSHNISSDCLKDPVG